MYIWKINMANGDSYVVKSDIGNSSEFINQLFGIGLNPIPTTNISTYDLHEPKGENKRVAIISNQVSSVEWY